MKILRMAAMVWIACMTLLVGLAVGIRSPKPLVTETRIFCAYGRIFVEFEDSGKIWGTLMLDLYGHPLPCKEGNEPEINNTI